MKFLLHLLHHACVYSVQSNIELHPKRLSTCDATEMGGHKQRIFLWDEPLAPSERNPDVTGLGWAGLGWAGKLDLIAVRTSLGSDDAQMGPHDSTQHKPIKQSLSVTSGTNFWDTYIDLTNTIGNPFLFNRHLHLTLSNPKSRRQLDLSSAVPLEQTATRPTTPLLP